MGMLVALGHLLATAAMLLLRIALPFVVLGAVVFLVLRRVLRGPRQKHAPEPESTQQKAPHFSGPVYTVSYEEVPDEPDRPPEPDRPRPFGQELSWLAVESRDPEAVLALLRADAVQPANWADGLDGAQEGRLFVSPAVKGWVFLAGTDCVPLPDALARQFPTVLAFAVHRSAAYYRWSRWEHGAQRRLYCWCGDQGRVLQDEGTLTAEEIALGFGRFPILGRERVYEALPTGEDVLDIAAAWGADVRFTDPQLPAGVGWLCDMPCGRG